MLYIEYNSPLSPLRLDSIEAIYHDAGGRQLTSDARARLRAALLLHRAEVFGPERMDANETGLLEQDLRYRSAELQRIERPELRAQLFVPMQDTVPTGAQSAVYKVWDSTGMAALISSFGDDVPLVGVSAAEVLYKFSHYALGYEISVEELEAAAFAGVPIQAEKGREVIRGFASRLEILAARGNADNGFTGLFNHPNLPSINAAAPGTGTDETWDGGDKTPAEVLKDLQTMVDTVDDNTLGVESVDTVILPRKRFRHLQTTPIEVGTGGDRRTILAEFSNHNPNVQIGWWHQADKAGPGNTPAALAYRRSPDVVRMEVQQPRQEPPLRKNFVQLFLSRARYGAVQWHRPLAGVRMEGI